MTGTSDVKRHVRRHLPDIVGVLVVCVVMLVGYFEIPFAGKTFSTSSYVLGFQGCGTTTGACNTNKPGDPRPDGGASAWFLEPSAQVVHRELADGDVPLWNPYGGIGAPLAANPQTGTLDPLMAAVFLNPSPLVTDLSILAWLLLTALAAYLAARALRMRPLVATVVGLVYGLSGWFYSDSNLWWFRVYLFLPVIIAMTEWTIRTRRKLPPALLGVALAGIVLVGMPEPMFMAIVAACLFAGARLLVGDVDGGRVRAALRLLGAAAIGVALASPLLLTFREYLSLSYNLHPFTGAPPGTSSVHQLIDWMMPKIIPTPVRAPFDDRQWIGAGAVLLAAIAMLHPRALRKHSGWPLALVAAVVGMQIFGGNFVDWTGNIPVWSQSGWVRFGTPVLALPIVLLAGVGLQTVLDGAIDRRRALVAAGVLVAATIVLILRDIRVLNLWDNVRFRGGWPLAVFTVAFIVIAAFVLPGRIAARAISAVVIVELLLLAPFGIYADRQNPYPKQPWIDFLQANTRDQSRVFSTQGFLYPDVATSYGLSDPRVLDALYPNRYWQYLKAFVSHGLTDRFTAVDPSESLPIITANPMFDLLGVRYLVFRDDPASVPPPGPGSQFRVAYRVGGVKVLENLHAAPRAFVVHDLHAVPDVDAALAFLTNPATSPLPDGKARPDKFDPRSSAVIEAEEQDAAPQACARDATSDAKIVSYSANDVKIEVTNSCPGLLVVSDGYYPGWSATVNGRGTDIFPTDVALRGVPVPAGKSTVELHFRPATFRNGMILFTLGIVALVVLAVMAWRSSRKPARV